MTFRAKKFTDSEGRMYFTGLKEGDIITAIDGISVTF